MVQAQATIEVTEIHSLDKEVPGMVAVMGNPQLENFQRPTAVRLIGRCNNCGETVEIIFTKKEIKQMLKKFQLPYQEANRRADKELEKQWNVHSKESLVKG